MMRLSTMKKMVDTLDENWKSPVANAIVQNWSHDPDSVDYCRSSANFIFSFIKPVLSRNGQYLEQCEIGYETYLAIAVYSLLVPGTEKQNLVFSSVTKTIGIRDMAGKQLS